MYLKPCWATEIKTSIKSFALRQLPLYAQIGSQALFGTLYFPEILSSVLFAHLFWAGFHWQVVAVVPCGVPQYVLSVIRSHTAVLERLKHWFLYQKQILFKATHSFKLDNALHSVVFFISFTHFVLLIQETAFSVAGIATVTFCLIAGFSGSITLLSILDVSVTSHILSALSIRQELLSIFKQQLSVSAFAVGVLKINRVSDKERYIYLRINYIVCWITAAVLPTKPASRWVGFWTSRSL